MKLDAIDAQVWSYLPSMDGQTILSIAIGTLVTLATFYVGYKQTIGAKEERLRAANIDLTGSVMRRVAVDREPLSYEHFKSLRRAKAFRLNVPEDRMLGMEHVMSLVLADTVDNHFLEKGSKTAVIQIIDDSRSTALDSSPSTNTVSSKQASTLFAALGATSLAFGAISSVLSVDFFRSSSIGITNGDLELGIIVFLAAIFVVTTSLVFGIFSIRRNRRMREHFEMNYMNHILERDRKMEN